MLIWRMLNGQALADVVGFGVDVVDPFVPCDGGVCIVGGVDDVVVVGADVTGLGDVQQGPM